MRTIIVVLLLATGVLLPYSQQAQIITTFAGSNVNGFSGDGGPATAAQFNQPHDIAVDALGNVYICVMNNNVIRKVNTSGIISTFAGSSLGIAGSGGDGGPATAAFLSNPDGITVDGAGNVYIAEQANNVVRKVNTSGIITTIAGGWAPGFSGDGGPAILATLHSPSDVAVDASGNIFIGDNQNHRVRKVDASGFISTYAGNGTVGYSGDGGPATAARFSTLGGIYTDAAGNVYIGDAGNSVVRKVDISGTITAFAGNGTVGYSGDGGPATAATFNTASNITIDNHGNFYITDMGNSVIRKVTAAGTISTFAGIGSRGYSGDGGPATACELYLPTGLAFGGRKLYITDDLNFVVREINTNNPPAFSGGSTQTLAVCSESTGTPINLLMAVHDTDAGDAEVWTAISLPAHGVLTGFSSTAISTGATTTPSGLLYTPTAGYTGTDAFGIQISDGADSAITTVNVTVAPCGILRTAVSTASQHLRVYPNPATGSFTVDIPYTGLASMVTVTDVLGRTTITKNIVGTAIQNGTLTITNIPAGNYVVKVSSGDVIFREKVVVW